MLRSVFQVMGKSHLGQVPRTLFTSYKVMDKDSSPTLTHVDESGKARMVDTTGKATTVREAKAVATIVLGEKAFKVLIE